MPLFKMLIFLIFCWFLLSCSTSNLDRSHELTDDKEDVYSNEKEYELSVSFDVERKLNDYLVNLNYINLSYDFLGDSKELPDGFEVKNINCIYKISRCRVIAKRNGYKDLIYWFKVYSKKLGYESKIKIKKNSILNVFFFNKNYVNAFYCENDLIEDKDFSNPISLVNDLDKGKPLCRKHTVSPPDVRKGELVIMTANLSGFLLYIKVKALDNGHVGDLIKVRIPTSGYISNGVVIKTGEVLLIK